MVSGAGEIRKNLQLNTLKYRIIGWGIIGAMEFFPYNINRGVGIIKGGGGGWKIQKIENTLKEKYSKIL